MDSSHTVVTVHTDVQRNNVNTISNTILLLGILFHQGDQQLYVISCDEQFLRLLLKYMLGDASDSSRWLGALLPHPSQASSLFPHHQQASRKQVWFLPNVGLQVATFPHKCIHHR